MSKFGTCCSPSFSLEQCKKPRVVHYIGIVGRRDQAPSYTQTHSTFEAAVADLANRYSLVANQLEQLSVTGNIQLDIEFHDDQWLLVVECDCRRLSNKWDICCRTSVLPPL